MTIDKIVEEVLPMNNLTWHDFATMRHCEKQLKQAIEQGKLCKPYEIHSKRVEAEKKYREAGLAYDERGDELFELKKQLAQANAKIRELEKGIK